MIILIHQSFPTWCSLHRLRLNSQTSSGSMNLTMTTITNVCFLHHIHSSELSSVLHGNPYIIESNSNGEKAWNMDHTTEHHFVISSTCCKFITSDPATTKQPSRELNRCLAMENIFFLPFFTSSSIFFIQM